MLVLSSRDRRGSRASRAGFTLVELLVVMGIIVMAAGLMTPSITEFFMKRSVDNLKNDFSNVFRRARLKAVTEGRNISVLFFREGPRIFDEDNRMFAQADWRPSLPLTREDTFYVLGGAGKVKSRIDDYSDEKFSPSVPYVPPIEWWKKRQVGLRKGLNAAGKSFSEHQYSLQGIARVTYHRDGTMSFGPGASDVTSIEFRKKAPTVSDIMIFQVDNRARAFIDLKITGATKSKIVVTKDPYYPEVQEP